MKIKSLKLHFPMTLNPPRKINGKDWTAVSVIVYRNKIQGIETKKYYFYDGDGERIHVESREAMSTIVLSIIQKYLPSTCEANRVLHLGSGYCVQMIERPSGTSAVYSVPAGCHEFLDELIRENVRQAEVICQMMEKGDKDAETVILHSER